MAQSSQFWDKISDRYSKSPVKDVAAYEKKLKITQDYLKPEMKVLEFGCGTGTTALIHATFVQHIHAIDISQKMLEIGQAKAEAGSINNVSFEQSGIDELNAEDASYDAVMGHSIMHLLEDKEAAIAKVYRLLKPGGLFVSSTPCLKGWMLILKAILPIGHFFGLLPKVKFFNEAKLIQSITNAGFTIDHQWQPGKGKALFLVARKSGA